MAATAPPPNPPTAPLAPQPPGGRGSLGLWQRLLFVVVLGLFLGAGLVAVALFLWPSSAADDLRFNLGSLEQFPPGTVTTFLSSSDSPPLPWTPGLRAPAESPSGQGPGTFHIVRLADGKLLALSARDPHLGCTVPYRPAFIFEGREGWFRNPCHGETYDVAGYRVFGPAPRGLDRFAVEVRDGSVHVDLGDLRRGPPLPPPGYELQTGALPGPLNAR